MKREGLIDDSVEEGEDNELDLDDLEMQTFDMNEEPNYYKENIFNKEDYFLY